MGKRSETTGKRDKDSRVTHGHARRGRSRAYRCWLSMRRRCSEPERYPYYNGVEIDSAWVDDFKNFLSDVGEPPTELHTLERVDGRLGYTKGNVAWATMAEQCRNKRNNIWFEGLILKDWCKSKGFRYKTVWAWHKRGVSLENIKLKGELLWGKDQTTKK